LDNGETDYKKAHRRKRVEILTDDKKTNDQRRYSVKSHGRSQNNWNWGKDGVVWQDLKAVARIGCVQGNSTADPPGLLDQAEPKEF